MVERGELAVDVVRVISCGEPLGAGLRRFLETVFHADVINFYGASESLAIELFYVQFYIRFVKEILPDSATGKKPLILTDCQNSAKEAVV